VALIARFLIDTSAAARMTIPAVAARLAPLIEAGVVATCATLDAEALFSARNPADYEQLWAELTEDEVFAPDESRKLEERLERLNALGFDVEEVELVSDGSEVRLKLQSKVVEPGHHRRRLLRLTGLDAQENQARRLLNDLTAYRTKLNRTAKAPITDTAAAGRWLSEVFEPAIAAVPVELQGKRAAAEIFHELLEHRWFLSEQAGRDVGMTKAIESYVEQVLRPALDEKAPLLEPTEDQTPRVG